MASSLVPVLSIIFLCSVYTTVWSCVMDCTNTLYVRVVYNRSRYLQLYQNYVVPDSDLFYPIRLHHLNLKFTVLDILIDWS